MDSLEFQSIKEAVTQTRVLLTAEMPEMKILCSERFENIHQTREFASILSRLKVQTLGTICRFTPETLPEFVRIVSKSKARRLELYLGLVGAEPALDDFAPVLAARNAEEFCCVVDDDKPAEAFLAALATSRLKAVDVSFEKSRHQTAVNRVLAARK